LPTAKPGSGGSAGRAIASLSFAAFAAQAMVRVTDSLLPQIATDFHVTVGAASIVVTGYLFAHGSVQLIIGPIGDRFGKYLCLSIGAVASCLMVLACGLAPSLPLLLAARVGSGLATGWIVPFALAFMGDVIPYERRQQVIGRFLSGQILGQLFGQIGGGVLGDLFGWRNVFFLLAALLAAAAVALWIEYWRNPVTRVSAVPRQPPRRFIADYALVLRSRWARALIIMAFLESGLMFGAFTYVGADLHHRFDVNFALVGLFVGTFAIGGLIYSLSVHLLVSWLGAAGLAACGGTLLAIAYVTLAAEPHYALAPFAITMAGLGFYMLHNTLQTNATQMTPEARGTAVSVFSAALYLGQTAAVFAGGAIFDHFSAVPIFVGAGMLLLAVALWLSWELRRRSLAA
jgi:predicted MFS family arabinose efflux permease